VAADEERDGVSLTNLDQALFDGAEATKRDLVDYLDAVAPVLLPELAGRPLSVIRVLRGQPPFMQKNLPKYTPDWVQRVAVWSEASKREISYALCDDRRTLLWFANQRAIEYHPTLYRAAEGWDHPTQLVLDIDPPEGGGFAVVVAAAHLVRTALTDCGLAGAVKTSGSKGVHVVVPITGAGGEEVAAATRALAARAERLDPALATTAFVREERHGKVFLDATRAGGATVVAAYSPRVRPGAPVSFPLTWDELDDADPHAFTVHTVPPLLGVRPTWADLLPAPQTLPAEVVEEGRAIPVARVQAMHAGKRRAAARREAAAEGDTGDA